MAGARLFPPLSGGGGEVGGRGCGLPSPQSCLLGSAAVLLCKSLLPKSSLLFSLRLPWSGSRGQMCSSHPNQLLCLFARQTDSWLSARLCWEFS